MINVNNKVHLHSATFSLKNKLARVLWFIIYVVLVKYSPVPFFRYRRCILRLLGSEIGSNVNIYPSVNIWLPSNLKIGNDSTLGPNVKVYNQGNITINKRCIISQGAHLCASTHDYNEPHHPLLLAPVNVGNDVWICTDTFIGPNVNVNDGCVIGARAVLTKSTEPWGVYAGNPCRRVNERKRFF